jgi:acyl-CoA synthetase (AMP-forming)/AMP-acid ligase II
MIFSPNSFAWPIALFGLLAGGVRTTLANSAYTPTELAFQYNDSGARIVFSHPDLVPIVFAMFKHIGVSEGEARRRLVALDLGGSGTEVARKVGVLGLDDLLGHGTLPEEEKFSDSQAGETQLLCYSSGTTGKPKGVEVCGFVLVFGWLTWLQTTHRNLTSILPMVKAIHTPLLPRRDVGLGVLPYFHIYGTRHHRHVTCMFANTPPRRRDARVISPLLRIPCGHLAQIRSGPVLQSHRALQGHRRLRCSTNPSSFGPSSGWA